MQSKKTGLVVGRFQPFHKGHLYLIKKALGKAGELVIGIGSSNINDSLNPFTVRQRKKMLETVIEKENLQDKIKSIVLLPDIPDDDEWVRETVKLTGPVDLIIGNNESGVNVFFEKHGFKVIRVPYYKREILEGTIVRKLLDKKDRSWKEAVPHYLIHQIESAT